MTAAAHASSGWTPVPAPVVIPCRFHDWPERLDAYFRARWHAPFAWGQNDCLLFAGGAVEAMTGVDPFAPAIGLYRTRRGALRALKAHGYPTYGDLLREVLGAPCTGWKRAQRGDVVIVDQPKLGPTVGIQGGGAIVAPGPRGVDLMPWSWVMLAWPVGRDVGKNACGASPPLLRLPPVPGRKDVETGASI